ncbi:MAG: CoA transferase [Actinobacteria bacterium]|nr:MAG: CoA transferase [Actinomycetota bacterium]
MAVQSHSTHSSGPLSGYRIIEIAGIGPGPFAAMMLADMGAEVIRVERTQSVRDQVPSGAHWDVLLRGRRNIAIDLKSPDGIETLLSLVEHADALIEGFRPGVMERLGLSPDICIARNPKIVFGRMTGWGQDGPYASSAGHDINYISLAGALAHFSRAGAAPVPPLNMVGDFGGGGMFLAYGVVCALLEAQKSGKGQVVDAAMIDGSAVLMSMFWAMKNIGMFDENKPGTNLLDTGAHFYDVFECSDGKYVSIGSIEPQFYALLLEKTGLANDPAFLKQMDASQWPTLKTKLAQVMRTKTSVQWCTIMEGTDVCFVPVLTMSEAAQHPHNIARNTFIEVDGVTQPAPAPRFSRTATTLPSAPAHAGQHSRAVLSDWGFDAARIDSLISSGAVVETT